MISRPQNLILRSQNQASERTQLVLQGRFYFHYSLATLTTNWAQIFTGLLFYACKTGLTITDTNSVKAWFYSQTFWDFYIFCWWCIKWRWVMPSLIFCIFGFYQCNSNIVFWGQGCLHVFYNVYCKRTAPYMYLHNLWANC